MNNEEKILELLTALTGKVDAMDGRLDRLETTQAKQGEQIAAVQATQREMQETLTRVAITQENIVLPRLDTLAEGHTHLVKTLATKEQVEELSGDVDVIKAVVTRHSGDISKLKKAQ